MCTAVAADGNLVTEGLELCKKIAYSLIRRLGLDSELIDDLLGSAQVGLAEALKRYDPSKGLDFISFAAIRIRGSCLDYLRTCTHLGPKAYKMAKALRLYHEYQEQTQPNSLKAEDLLCVGALTWKISVEKTEIESKHSESDDPDLSFEKKEISQLIRKIVHTLPRLYRDIYEACYEGDMSFADFAKSRKVTKASVSKAHKRMLDYVKSKLYEIGYFN